MEFKCSEAGGFGFIQCEKGQYLQLQLFSLSWDMLLGGRLQCRCHRFIAESLQLAGFLCWARGKKQSLAGSRPFRGFPRKLRCHPARNGWASAAS